MIIIHVVAFNGAPLAQPLSASFDELGGNIGRAENNQLVLPDPERTISRVHAQVVFRSGRYGIVDRGSNPITIDGRPLGNGQEAPLQGGEQIQIGGYLLRAEASVTGAPAAPADPFADFGGLAAPAPAPRGVAASRPPAGAPAAAVDPLAAFGFGAAPAVGDPFAGLGGGGGRAPVPAPSASGIPDDWDPFAPSAAPAGPQDFSRTLGQGSGFGLETGGAATAPLIPDLPGSGGAGDSLDQLFGLGPAAGGDPLAGSVFGQAAAQPNMAAHADPLRSLNSLTQASPTAESVASPELHNPFTLPTAVAQPAVPQPAVVPPAGAPVSPVMPAAPRVSPPGAVLSWNDPSGESRTLIRGRGAAAPVPPLASPAAIPDDFFEGLGAPPAAAAPALPATPPAVPLPPADPFGGDDPFAFDEGRTTIGTRARPAPPPVSPTPATARPPVPAAAAVPAVPPVAASAPLVAPVAASAPPMAPVAAPAPVARPSVPAGGADEAALIAALREGLQMPTLGIDSLTPTFMRLLGQLVHESTRGTVDLLVARAALKREVRAEITMIVAKENNPLKFSPSVEVALGHLLNPPARGFMPADRAIRDAYDDLRAHQFAFLAGMRAALEGVMRRFDPAELEGKLTQKKSMLAALLPATRKAQLWEAFTELYGQISAEAQDDFHELFGKEFLRAYEAQLDELAKDRR